MNEATVEINIRNTLCPVGVYDLIRKPRYVLKRAITRGYGQIMAWKVCTR